MEEKPTGQLQLSAGFSSLESFIFQASIRQDNFRGRGQTIGLSVDYSYYSRSVQVSFTEPYLFDRNISMGVDVYRRDYNSFNYLNSNRNTTYKQTTTGFQIRAGVPLTEYMSLIGRYTLNFDDVTLDEATYYLDGTCSPLLAGRYLCDAIGSRVSSIIGTSLVYDTLDNRMRPTKGTSWLLSGDIAGLGGSVKYARITANAAHYWPLGKGFVFSLRGEGGAIAPLASRSSDPTVDDVRLTDRFFLGQPQMRGFDIRGVGPRVLRKYYSRNSDGTFGAITTDRNSWSDDALGGRFYYIGHAEMEIPLGAGAREMGLRPSIFMDAGAVWGVRRPATSTGVVLYTDALTGKVTTAANASDGTANSTYQKYDEVYVGNSPQPRVSIGVGVNWNSPFGPFRIDFAKVLKKVDGDDTQPITFNVGTQF